MFLDNLPDITLKEDNQPIFQRDQFGGYISLKVNLQDATFIVGTLKDLGIGNCIELDKMHLTLMYDKSNPNFEKYTPAQTVYKANIVGIEPLGEVTSKWFAVVLMLECEELVERFKELEKIGFKHSHETLKLHTSLKYQATEKDIQLIKDNVASIIKHLPNTPYIRLECENSEIIKD